MADKLTPESDRCDAEWTKWLQDTWAGTKDIQRDTAPETPIDCARRLERERDALLCVLRDVMAPETTRTEEQFVAAMNRARELLANYALNTKPGGGE